jgi:predicted DNA-binding transcriptional regulator AlpA
VNAPQLEDRLLTTREVAQLLAVHPKTVLRFAGRGGSKRRPKYETQPDYQPLPCTYVGGRLRFRVSEVTAWVARQREGGR